MMDIVSKVPIEISLHIFSFLPHRDLVSCFKVCKGWREIANCNLLWKKRCLPYATEDEIKKACSRVDRSIPTADLPSRLRYCLRKRVNKPTRCNLDPWCGCARLFKYKYRKFLCNWKNGNYVFNRLKFFKPEFNVVCSRRTLTICFYQPQIFSIINVSANGIEDIGLLEIPLPQYDSVQISPDYLAVSWRNFVRIYKKNSGEYKYYRTLVVQIEQPVTEGAGQSLESSTRNHAFTVILICGHYAWFRSASHIYIINLESGVTIKIIFENSNLKHDNNNKVVAWSKGVIKIFNVHGHLLHERKVRSQIEKVAFEETYALLCRAKSNSKAYIEWWDPLTAKRRVLKRVEGRETSMVVRGENVFILEVEGECSSKVSAIHSVTGITYWVHTISMDTFSHSESTIFEGICGKYLFVYVPSLSNKKYYLIDMNKGVGLHTKEFGEGKPFLFNEKVVVIARNKYFWIMSYL